jgi:hypothetical protein
MRLLEETAFALEDGTMGWSADASTASRIVQDTHTERFRSSLMALISIFLRPMMDNELRCQSASNSEAQCCVGARAGRCG